MKLTEFRKLIREEVRKVVRENKLLKEYLINNKSKISDITDLNVFVDTSELYDSEVPKKLLMKYKPVAEKLEKELKPFFNQVVPAQFVTDLDASWYDGSDIYEDGLWPELEDYYKNQIKIVTKLIKFLKSK